MILINKPDHTVPRTKKTLSHQQPIVPIDNTNNKITDFQGQDLDKIEIINSSIEKKIKLLTTRFLMNNDLHHARKLENDLDIMTSLLDLKEIGENTVDFKKIINSRDNKQTQRKNFKPKCFGTKQKNSAVVITKNNLKK